MFQDTLIVGAGVSGLCCAGELVRAGRKVVVLERARGIGGRCATRTIQGQAVDFGPMFLHGSGPAFMAALAGLPGDPPLVHWPRKVEGNGPPCQPGALDPSVGRVAYARGLKSFPRHLAQGLEIRLATTVTSLQVVDDGFKVTTAEGAPLRCRDLVLALALEESRQLLATLPASPEVAGIQALLGLFASMPCLTLIAGYPLDGPAPSWELLYPAESEVMQLIAQDSTKRDTPRFRIFVAQARPVWSRRHLETDEEQWAGAMLQEMEALLGPWALQPLWTHAHRWRHARVDAASELTRPVQITFPGGQRLGLAGDVFSRGGGVQAAWLSGSRLAERLMTKECP